MKQSTYKPFKRLAIAEMTFSTLLMFSANASDSISYLKTSQPTLGEEKCINVNIEQLDSNQYKYKTTIPHKKTSIISLAYKDKECNTQTKSSSEKERLIEQIQKYKDLPKHWANSSLPSSKTKKQITSKTIEHAKVFIECLTDKTIKNLEIYPRGYDGISFVWEKKAEGKYLEVTITSEEHLSYFLEGSEEFILSDDNDELETFEKFPQLEKLLIDMS